MQANFRQFLEHLEPKFQALVTMSPVRFASLPPRMPERGIYLFSEGPKHLYVGRTNRLKKRLAGHCRPSSTHYSATFAFRIARIETGMLRATYTQAGSRADLAADETFAAAFRRARERVAAMDLRFVEETEAVRQALLEIYAAIVLQTPFNDFDNH